MDTTKKREQYLLSLLTDIKREIIAENVIREQDNKFNWEEVYHLKDKTQRKVLTVLCILMGGDLPNHGLYSIRDFSLLWTWLEDEAGMTIE